MIAAIIITTILICIYDYRNRRHNRKVQESRIEGLVDRYTKCNIPDEIVYITPKGDRELYRMDVGGTYKRVLTYPVIDESLLDHLDHQ